MYEVGLNMRAVAEQSREESGAKETRNAEYLQEVEDWR
jgi:hypothetical protein